MKFNWGTGIFLFYTFFVGSLIFQVYKSTQYNNHLVVENYYEEDLAYQKKYEKQANSLNLKQSLSIRYDQSNGVVVFQFPEEFQQVKGNILFYRASDKDKDLKLPIQLNEVGQMSINAHKFQAGNWSIQVDWVGDNKPFFDEKTIFIPTP